MAKKKPTLLSNSMQYGAMTGIGLFIVFIIVAMTGSAGGKGWQQVLSISILVLGIIVGTKSYREHVLNGRLRYAQGVGSGTLISLFCSIIIAFFTFLYLKFVDASMLDQMIVETEKGLIERKMTDEQIDKTMTMVRKFQTPGFVSSIGILTYTAIGFGISLITSAFLKKGNDNFEDFVAENQ
jgi:hypothetical protein